MESADPQDAELTELFERAGWLRGLARSLVRDADAADDLVQETWLRARDRAPTGAHNVRGWLATVMLNLARQRRRGDSRRLAREQDAARAEAAEGTHRALDTLDTLERLAAEVRELDEPYRTAIAMHFHQGLSAREIAARFGIPVATVQTRLKRGLARLRERLDRRGGRERWLAAFAPFARPTLRGELAPASLHAKLAVGGALLVALISSWIAFAPENAVGVTTTSPEPSIDAAPRAIASAAQVDERDTLTRPRPAATAAVAAPLDALVGCVVDERDTPIANLAIELRAETSVLAATRSDAFGRFQLDEPSMPAKVDVADARYVALHRPCLGAIRPRRELALVVARRAPIRGMVRGPRGEPVAGAFVAISIGNEIAARMSRSLQGTERAAFATRTGADGSFELASAPDVDEGWIAARASGAGAMVALRGLDRSNVELVLASRALAGPTVRGAVIDADGAAVAAAHVFAWDPAAPIDRRGVDVATDAEGRFEVPLLDAQPGARIEIRAIARGWLPASAQCAADCAQSASWPDPLVLRLEREALAVRGRVLRADGTPAVGAELAVLDGTDAGLVDVVGESVVVTAKVDVETLISNGSLERRSVADQRGEFVVDGLLERSYRLRAFDPSSLASVATAPIEAGSSGVELRLPAATSPFEGRVIDDLGEPVPRAKITLHAEIEDQDGLRRAIAGAPLSTDDAGRFLVPALAVLPRMVHVEPTDERWAPHYAFTRTGASPMVLTIGRTCWVKVELGPGRRAASLSVLDEARTLLPLRASLSAGSPSQHTLHGIVETSEVFGVGSGARHLLLRDDAGKQRTIELRLEPGSTTIVRVPDE